MSTSQYHPTDRGVLYRAPTMRIYHSPVVAPGSSERSLPSWLTARQSGSWQPLQLTWASNGRLSSLTLKAKTHLAPGVTPRVEDVEVADGDMMVLMQFGSGSAWARRRIEWFRGYVADREMVIEPDHEGLVITAYGPEIRLRSKVVSGRWHKTAAADDSEIQGTLTTDDTVRENVFQSDLPVVFNENGAPNASQSDWRLAAGPLPSAGKDCRVFEPSGREIVYDDQTTITAAHWTAYTALRSLVELVDNYEVISPHTVWDQIKSLLDDVPIGEVRVEGMSLLEAIAAVLLPVGFGFALEPWAVGNGRDVLGRARHRLLVFSLRNPSAVKAPQLAPTRWGNVAADSLRGRRVEVQRIGFLRECRDVANHVEVLGDQRRTQVVLEFSSDSQQRDLHPLWDTQDHPLADWADSNVVDPWQWPSLGDHTFRAFSDRYNVGGQEHGQHRHVFRSFAWNEDGALSSMISKAPDLSAYGIGDHYVRRPRPLASTFTYDASGQNLRLFPRAVQLGIEGDDESWIDVPAEIWNDRAAFTISAPLLAGNAGGGQWYPYAPHKQHADAYRNLHYLTLLHNALRGDGQYRLCLRLMGSIECDDAVKGAAPRRVLSAWPFRARKVLRLGKRFQWRQVEDNPFVGLVESASVNDSDAAEDYARRVRDAREHATGHGSVMLRYLTRAYVPGDGIGGTAGRNVNLHVDGDRRNHPPVITAVVWDFDQGANKTELLLDSAALRVTK